MRILLLTLLVCCFMLGTISSTGDLVEHLPGQPAVGFKHYAGQVPVNEKEGRAVFYWFFEADHPDPSSLPVTLWLNGGPGCSSIGNGALAELGPFRVQKSGKSLFLNEFSWTRASNIIFLESPAGVGYGYVRNDTESQQSDGNTVRDNMAFLSHWFKEFPQYKDNDFYIAGESYAGHYIPTLAMEILAHNALNPKPSNYINLKGIAIGNPWTDAQYDDRSRTDFFYAYSEISDETYESLVQCNDEKSCNTAESEVELELANVNRYDILEDDVEECIKNNRERYISKIVQRTRVRGAVCRDHIGFYLNMNSVQDALHIQNPREWIDCNDYINENYNQDDFYKSMLPLYNELVKSHLHIWIFSGDMDGVVPTIGTRRWLRALNLTIAKPWYPWNSQGKVGGWGQVYKNLTFATVRGAGHMVPSTQPQRGFDLFKAFLSGNLPRYQTSYSSHRNKA